jgi:hypothetical protein
VSIFKIKVKYPVDGLELSWEKCGDPDLTRLELDKKLLYLRNNKFLINSKL